MKKAILITFLTVFVQLNYGQFITTWETTSSNQSIIIPTNSVFTYNYSVDWGDGSLSSNQSGDAQHTYASAGTYTVSITGAFPAIYFNAVGPFNPTLSANRTRIKTVQQWGANNWLSMNNAFSGCSNLTITATDNPNLSQVTDMSLMFYQNSNMTVDASSWDVSNVTQMNSLFNQADDFNSDISNWDLSNVTNMASMFYEAGSFNQDISNWDVSNVTNMNRMFNRAFVFNQDIGNWNVSSVTDMNAMFEQAFAFNQDIGNWDVGNVTDMNSMFLRNPIFDQPIGSWNVSNVTDMDEMFQETIFNQDIGNWDLSSVTTMSGMFEDNAFFNQDIGSWDVSSVTDMSNMFTEAIAFNQDIANWDVSSVTNMSSLFSNAAVFNQNISTWDVSSVTDMSNMFRDAVVFNQDIGNWDVSNVSDMFAMFDNALAFNQDLGNWNIINVNDMFNMLDNTNLSVANYDATLIGWSSQNVMPDIFLGADGLTYCSGDSARTILISPPNNWTISQDALDCSSQPFINIPDPNFEQALINLNIDSDLVVNGLMAESDALGVIDLDVSSQNISDLTGIEFFTDLETLSAFDNNLSSIDLSQNTQLISALLALNNLSTIDLSNNPNLISISLNGNNLSTIDLSNNTNLLQVFVNQNNLSSIDVSMLSNLENLGVAENSLTDLDISQNPNLFTLFCNDNLLQSLNVKNGNNTNFTNLEAQNNPDLECIQVDDVSFSNNNWLGVFNFDSQMYFSLDCSNLIDIPDPNFEQALIELSIDSDQTVNGLMAEAEALAVVSLNVNSKNISDLTGIEFFTNLDTLLALDNNLSTIDLSANAALETLNLSLNNLTQIDLSSNLNLTSLSLAGSQLSSLDVSNNTGLTQLYVGSNNLSVLDVSSLTLLAELEVPLNQLVELDLSQNPILNKIYVNDNSLVNLNVKNGNNSTITNSFFNATNNSNLFCIEVDDENYSTSTWTNLDAQSSFGEDCAPSNDDCSDAQSITLGQDVPSTTQSSTSSGNVPGCQDAGLILVDVWFQFVAPASGSVTLTQDAGTLTLKSALYENCTDLTPIACGTNGLQVDNLTPGQTYYVQTWVEADLSGFLPQSSLTEVGDFTIKIDDTSTLSDFDFNDFEASFKMYPNPAQTYVNLNANQSFNGFEVYSINGQKLLSEYNLNTQNHSVDVSMLSKGVYLIKVSSENSTLTQKLIIK